MSWLSSICPSIAGGSTLASIKITSFVWRAILERLSTSCCILSNSIVTAREWQWFWRGIREFMYIARGLITSSSKGWSKRRRPLVRLWIRELQSGVGKVWELSYLPKEKSAKRITSSGLKCMPAPFLSWKKSKKLLRKRRRQNSKDKPLWDS